MTPARLSILFHVLVIICLVIFFTVPAAAPVAFLFGIVFLVFGGAFLVVASIEEKKPVTIAHFTSDDLGIGPRNDGRGNYRCDGCQKLRPASRVTISPGDGYVECDECETRM